MSGTPLAAGPSGGRERVLVVLLALAVALSLALAAILAFARPQAQAAESFDRGAWYAVFLDDKEAFVGHISSLSGSSIAMDHLFYLTFEAKDAAGNPLPSPRPEDFKPTLKKLGQEIWGPEDFVRIDRGKVEYYTRLRPDSPVVAAIARYQPTPAPSASPSR
jgi:hypothetical protein